MISDARMLLSRGAVRTDTIPENQGATLGMKAREKGFVEEGIRDERCREASRS